MCASVGARSNLSTVAVRRTSFCTPAHSLNYTHMHNLRAKLQDDPILFLELAPLFFPWYLRVQNLDKCLLYQAGWAALRSSSPIPWRISNSLWRFWMLTFGQELQLPFKCLFNLWWYVYSGRHFKTFIGVLKKETSQS